MIQYDCFPISHCEAATEYCLSIPNVRGVIWGIAGYTLAALFFLVPYWPALISCWHRWSMYQLNWINWIIYLYLLTRFESKLEMQFSEKNKELFFEIFNYCSPYCFNTKCLYLEYFIEHFKHFQMNILNLSPEFNSAKSLLKYKDILKPDLYSIMNTWLFTLEVLLKQYKFFTLLLLFQ